MVDDDNPTQSYTPEETSPSSGPDGGSTKPEVGSQLSNYRLDKRLGQGGQGTVFRARDLAVGRDVAIKVLDDAAESDRNGVLREARKAASISHPNVVALLHVSSESESPPYLVTEYIEGKTLAEIIADEGPLVEEAAFVVLRDVVEGLVSAHATGLIHLDIKPGNVLVDGKTGAAKITDFGVSIDHEERWRHAGGGTLVYMAPEQIQRRSEQFDGRTDLWAVGVILYEMVTGRRPFGADAATPAELKRGIVSVDPKPPSQWNPAVSEACDAICARCLRKNVDERYPSASRLLQDIGAAADARGSRKPEEAGEEPEASTSRGQILVGGCLAVVVVAIVVVLTAFGIVDANDAQEYIEKALRMLRRGRG